MIRKASVGAHGRNPSGRTAAGSTRQVFLPLASAFVALGCFVLPAGAQETPAGPYFDDTFDSLDAISDVNIVNGSFGYERYQFEEPADGDPLALDARNADFTVSNSRNSNPTSSADCDVGTSPVNPYPLNVYDADFTAVVGGIIYSDVPQESDWEPTYCNSAAVHFKYASNGIVDGIRITGAWDAIRMESGSPELTVRNSWISDVRDDILENDHFYSAVFEDNLVDGAFQGISVHSGGSIGDSSSEVVVLSGNVIKIREYLYKGGQQFGALFKAESEAPSKEIHDTVVAVEFNGGSTWSHYWDESWSKINSCSNNLFLWLSDAAIPSAVGSPPSCFTVVRGQEARDLWQQAKENWINCHPLVARAAGDPQSETAQCIADTFGGYSDRPFVAPMPPVLHSAL